MQCCSNLQHQSLPSTNLYPEQLRKIIHRMGRLQTLELKVGDENNITELFSDTVWPDLTATQDTVPLLT